MTSFSTDLACWAVVGWIRRISTPTPVTIPSVMIRIPVLLVLILVRSVAVGHGKWGLGRFCACQVNGR